MKEDREIEADLLTAPRGSDLRIVTVYHPRVERKLLAVAQQLERDAGQLIEIAKRLQGLAKNGRWATVTLQRRDRRAGDSLWASSVSSGLGGVRRQLVRKDDGNLDDLLLRQGPWLAQRLAEGAGAVQSHAPELLGTAEQGPFGVDEAEDWDDGYAGSLAERGPHRLDLPGHPVG